MSKPDISTLNKGNIKKGKLAKLVPELYELKGAVENNPWHDKEPVFSHVLSVLGSLEKIIKGSKRNVRRALDEVVDKNSRKDLLRAAASLHDISKKETMVDLGDGARGCPEHEKKGAKKAGRILRRFNISKRESKIIVDIVRNHGVIHDIVGLGYENPKKDSKKNRHLTHSLAGLENKNFLKEYRNFKKKFSNIYLELILLAFADTIGSYLKKTNPAEFRHRINFYKRELKAY